MVEGEGMKVRTEKMLASMEVGPSQLTSPQQNEKPRLCPAVVPPPTKVPPTDPDTEKLVGRRSTIHKSMMESSFRFTSFRDLGHWYISRQ